MLKSFIIACLLITGPAFASDSSIPSQRVGLPLEIRDVYILGDEIETKPRRDREPPLVVRILEIKPAKDGSRYDFEVHGLEPGKHNLADYLEAPEGTTIPAIPLEITTELPPGLVRPNNIEPGKLPELGGYRTTMIVVASVWFAGLIVILLWRGKRPETDTADHDKPATLGERLLPLVNKAASGQLTTEDRAQIDRLVIGHWREKRPEIAALSPAEAMIRLRDDEQAAPLLQALEKWLHSRDSNPSNAEIEALLAPYAS